jgi:hypothetical protein
MNLHYLFVHVLVHNKHLLFNMHGMNIKSNRQVFCFGISMLNHPWGIAL